MEKTFFVVHLSGQTDDGHMVILHSANLNLSFFVVLQEVCKRHIHLKKH